MNFSAHALQRMQQRGISADWVYWALLYGARAQQAHGNWFVAAQYVDIGGNWRTLTVITDPTYTVVVSTWWN